MAPRGGEVTACKRDCCDPPLGRPMTAPYLPTLFWGLSPFLVAGLAQAIDPANTDLCPDSFLHMSDWHDKDPRFPYNPQTYCALTYFFSFLSRLANCIIAFQSIALKRPCELAPLQALLTEMYLMYITDCKWNMSPCSRGALLNWIMDALLLLTTVVKIQVLLMLSRSIYHSINSVVFGCWSKWQGNILSTKWGPN